MARGSTTLGLAWAPVRVIAGGASTSPFGITPLGATGIAPLPVVSVAACGNGVLALARQNESRSLLPPTSALRVFSLRGSTGVRILCARSPSWSVLRRTPRFTRCTRSFPHPTPRSKRARGQSTVLLHFLFPHVCFSLVLRRVRSRLRSLAPLLRLLACQL